MSEHIKGQLQGASFYPEGEGVETSYITLTFRVPDTTTVVSGEWTLYCPSYKREGEDK